MQLYINIIFIVVILGYLYWLWGLIRALQSDVPYVPMDPKTIEAMMAMVHPAPGSVWYDLGSGDGRVLIAAAKKFKVKAVGIEKIGSLRLLSKIRIARAHVSESVRIKAEDFFETDLSDASIISLYSLPDTIERLRSKLLKECKPGTIIVSHRYPLEGFPVIQENAEHKLYVARI